MPRARDQVVAGNACAFWKPSASFRSIPCSSSPTTWRPSPKGEKLNTALVNKLTARIARNPACRAPRSRRREERHGLRLLDRQAYRRRAQAQSACGDRKGRQRSRETEGRARLAGAAPARHAARLTTTPITRRRERRSFTPIPSSSAATISSGMQGTITPGAPRKFTARAGPRTPAAGWWARLPRCPTRWPRPSRTS